jgi:hypothetical protein
MTDVSPETLAKVTTLLDSAQQPETTLPISDSTIQESDSSNASRKQDEPKADPTDTDWGKNFRALTKKEKALREREAALKEKEAKISESEKHWNEVNSLIQSDPLTGLEKLGIDYNTLTSTIVKRTLHGDIKTLSQEDIDSLVDSKLNQKEEERLHKAIQEKEEAVTKQLADDRQYISGLITEHETEFPYLTILTDLRGGDSVSQAIQDFMFESYEASGKKSVVSYSEALHEVEKAAKAKFGPSFEKRFGIKFNPQDSSEQNSESPKQALTEQTNSSDKAHLTRSKTLTNQISTQATEKKPLSREEKIRRIKDSGW